MNCPHCEAKIRADDADLNILVAKCAKCQNVFGFERGLATSTVSPPSWPPDCSATLRVEDDDREKHLIYRWSSINGTNGLLLAQFAFLWNIVAWALTIILWPDVQYSLQLLVLLFFPAVGAWLAYFAFAIMINKTTLSVTDATTTVRHGPLPWPGSVDLSTEEIRGFHCISGQVEPGLNMTAWVKLRALMVDGSEQKLLGLPLAEGLFAGRLLEQWLKVPTRGDFDELPTLRQADSR